MRGVPNAPYRNMNYKWTHHCEECGKEFRSSRRTARLCSALCRKRLQRKDPTWMEPRDRAKRDRRRAMGLED